ncbi:hypothetical protein PI124_g19155 [Phytophthora idaei]|nr:hypothetical protein PI126_g18523 [Phytophthora idaei]KAG3235823.1 hypothetical protein PI124_g19155 [Phytophthora idaei]
MLVKEELVGGEFTQKTKREKAEAAEEMNAIGEGLNNIAEAFKVARTQNDNSHETVGTLRELTETMQARTQPVNSLLQFLPFKPTTINSNGKTNAMPS